MLSVLLNKTFPSLFACLIVGCKGGGGARCRKGIEMPTLREPSVCMMHCWSKINPTDRPTVISSNLNTSDANKIVNKNVFRVLLNK